MNENAPTPTANDQPLVSGIMIFLNAAKYIEEAIESVFAQTYENWELILVDDGSTDASTEIAKRYANTHPGKVRYVEHPEHENRGMSASRNLGFKNARGAYLTLLDADDVWLSHKLKDQVAIMNAQPEAMMMYGRTVFWWSWSGRPDYTQREYFTRLGLKPDQLIQPPHLLTHMVLHEDAVPCTCSVMIRPEVFERVGYFEEEFRSQSEDLIFHAKVSLHCPIYVASGVWDKYRQHEENSVTQAIAAGEFHCFKPNPVRERYLRWVCDYVASQNAHDPDLDRALRRQLWPYRHPHAMRIKQCLTDCWMAVRHVLKVGFRCTTPHWLEYALGRRLRGTAYPIPKGLVDFGILRRLWPVCDASPDRGTPVSDYYIEQFLSRRDHDLKGRVIECPTSRYTQKLGAGRVKQGEVLPALQNASTGTLPPGSFDCAIIVRDLARVDDVPAALQTLRCILKPGGVLLAALPGISAVSHPALAKGFFQTFTKASAERLFAEVFPAENIRIECFGNVFTAMASLHGISADELQADELAHRDPRYDVIIGIRAVKPRE